MNQLVKALPILFLGVLLIGFAGCNNKDQRGNLNITFKSTFNGEPLVVSDVFNYLPGQKIQITKNEMYLSDLVITGNSSGTVFLSDIELVDMTATSETQASQGVTLTFTDLPTGTYRGIQFGIGVESGLNATVPEDYSSSHVLSDPGRYWMGWSSYIFSKTEGFLDTVLTGGFNQDLSFAYHTGSDDLYEAVASPQTNFTVFADQTSSITITLDYYLLLGLPNNAIDIKSNPQNHTPSDTTELRQIVDNYTSSLTLQVD